MNEARAIEEHVDRPNVGCGFLNGLPVTHVQPLRPNPWTALNKSRQRRFIYICGPYGRALARQMRSPWRAQYLALPQ